ncbi:hypothetical protein TNIN_352761 [Trichonephila inaurata madagascariensis]|uniref:Uncharacterized protein n=1 Tax=Trichonephila inaurata madagascariensis TaxID=2747483 RepID=A0A8X6JQT2_9ARAC|nr:hypothetical protein TNIN_352761 [Trichonephila inaurata madagascariensis]
MGLILRSAVATEDKFKFGIHSSGDKLNIQTRIFPESSEGVDEKTLQTTTKKDFTFEMKIFENGGNGMP